MQQPAISAAKSHRLFSGAKSGHNSCIMCPSGQRNAGSSECLAAVQKAAQATGVEVKGLKNVDDGPAANVPYGCSYSSASKMSIFNVNPAGKGGDIYLYVCSALPKPLVRASSSRR